MRTTTTPRRFELEPSDFSQNPDGSLSISLPTSADYSFSRDNSLVIPSQASSQQDTDTFTFQPPPPSILYAHKTLNGDDGRLLPATDAFSTASILSTKKTTPLPPRGKNSPEQEENLPDTVDSTITKVVAGGRVAWSASMGYAPSSSIRIACENKKLSTIMFFATIVETDPHDPLAIVEPVGVDVMVGADVNGMLLPPVTRMGGALIQKTWHDDDGVREKVELPDGGWRWSSIRVDGLGYQYAMADGVRAYRSVDGKWGDSIEYVFVVDLSDLIESLPPASHIVMRYSTGLDANGNFIWRGWSVGVGFTVNSKPIPPVFNGVERGGAR